MSNNLRRLGCYAFSGCKSLETIRLPDNLEYIGKGAFENCQNLKTIQISIHSQLSDFNSLDDAVYACNKFEGLEVV